MIIVSACLCGINTRYDGESCYNEKAYNLFKEGKAILICPEQLGGLTTPRVPHEIQDGTGTDVLNGRCRVVGRNGMDSTSQFIKGAEESLKIAKDINAKIAILKSKSPSCGNIEIYNGSFNKNKIQGKGVTAELFSINGITVYNEEELEGFDVQKIAAEFK